MYAANSIREQILQAVLAALRPVAEQFGATLQRSPTLPISREQSPALLVFPESDTITALANDRVSHELTLRMVALARASAPHMPETEADRLLSNAHAALFLDVNLGGLALGIRALECEWDVEEADAVAAAIPARYAITYRSLVCDLTHPG